jgi:hypothetical protein
MDDDETQHLLELRNVLEQRKRLYERQQAILAPHEPPDVVIGLASTLRELELVEAKLRLPLLDPKVLALVGADGQHAVQELHMRRFEQEMRDRLAHNDDQRYVGQRRTQIILIAVVVGQFVGLLVLVVLATVLIVR